MKQFIEIDGKEWPIPHHSLLWEFGYANKPSKESIKMALRTVDAYWALLHKPKREKDKIIKQLEIGYKEQNEWVRKNLP